MSGYLSPSATNTQGISPNALVYCKTNIGGYFFDGFISVQHQRELEITQNPVETGASIVDHSYMKPVSVTMKILVSDVHASLVEGQFSQMWSRAASAWSVLKQLQEDRIPVSVLTKFDLYENMLIKSLSSVDEANTYTTLMADVTLQEIPIARVRTVKISAADQATLKAEMGKIEVERMDKQDVSILSQWTGRSYLDDNSKNGGAGRK